MQKACKSCRSHQQLSNEYFLAKFGVDTEENEPYQSLIIWLKNQSKLRYRTFQLSRGREFSSKRDNSRPPIARSAEPAMPPAAHPNARSLVERFDSEPYCDFSAKIMTKLHRARSLLYRRQILQENMRWKTLDEIYKIYMLLHRSDLYI